MIALRTRTDRTPLHTPPLPRGLVPTATLIARGRLTDAARIERLMADDLRSIAAARGSADAEDLRLLGWRQAQITAHGTAAADLAHARALRQAS